jgi:undecaprenyl-diphosphatase
VLPRDLGDERAYLSLRRAVEHEALLPLAASGLGVRTPRFVALASAQPAAFVLAYEAIDAKSLDRLDPGDLDDEMLAAIWSQVGLLRHRRVAHRDLRLANLFLASDGSVWIIDFGFSELTATDALLAGDLAELLASTSLHVGVDRSVSAAIAALGWADVATAIDRLHPRFFSGATRTAMKARPEHLAKLCAAVELRTATLPRAAEPGRITVSPRSESRCAMSRCPPSHPGERRAGSGGSSSARTDASRL